MTTTDPSSGSSAPGDVHVIPGTGQRRVVEARGEATGIGGASAKGEAVVGSAYAAAAAADTRWLKAVEQAREQALATDADQRSWSILRNRSAASFFDRETAVLALEPKFQALSDAVLHLIAEKAEPAGPHVGNPDFPEDMLQAFARYEQEQREAKRLRESAKQDRRVSFIEKIALLIVGGLVTLGLKALFFPSP